MLLSLHSCLTSCGTVLKRRVCPNSLLLSCVHPQVLMTLTALSTSSPSSAVGGVAAPVAAPTAPSGGGSVNPASSDDRQRSSAVAVTPLRDDRSHRPSTGSVDAGAVTSTPASAPVAVTSAPPTSPPSTSTPPRPAAAVTAAASSSTTRSNRAASSSVSVPLPAPQTPSHVAVAGSGAMAVDAAVDTIPAVAMPEANGGGGSVLSPAAVSVSAAAAPSTPQTAGATASAVESPQQPGAATATAASTATASPASPADVTSPEAMRMRRRAWLASPQTPADSGAGVWPK